MKCPNCKKIFMEHLKTRIMPSGKQYEYYVCNNCNKSFQFEVKTLTAGQMFPQMYDNLEEEK